MNTSAQSNSRPPSLMAPTEQLGVVVPALIELVASATPGDLDRPTPCDRFDVQGVLEHMSTLGGLFAVLFRGGTPDPDAFAREAITDDQRDGDRFKAATTPPATATPLERLAAFSGRTV